MKSPSLGKVDVQEFIENAQAPDPYLAQYSLLQEKSPDELATLDKSVVKKLDWKFLPAVTMMLLMKYTLPFL